LSSITEVPSEFQAKTMIIRPANAADANAIWAILEPIIRAGETYALPQAWGRENALAYWHAADHEVFVAENAGLLVGT
jgi:hypothetical protein